MRDEDVSEDAPGRLVRYGRESYYQPDPLPPARDLDLDDAFYETLSGATFWLGKLSGLNLTVEFPPVLYTSLLRKEAMESAEIEGADVDFNALYSAETRAAGEDEAAGTADEGPAAETATKDIQEVLNYERAVAAGIDALDTGESVSVPLLHDLHETLLSGVRSDTDTIGAFRETPVHVGEFVPSSPEAVPGAMDALLTYVRTGGSYHPLVDVALTHYQFETVHPYGDGNGRLGRLLVTLQLYADGYLEQPALYLSEYFNRNRQTYVDRLQAVRTAGEWEQWLTFVVAGIERQARESVERSLELNDLEREYREAYGDGSRADARLALRLFEQPYLTAAMVEDLLGVSGPTAYRAIQSLESDGVLEEVTGKERYREWRAAEIFEVLEQPPRTY